MHKQKEFEWQAPEFQERIKRAVELIRQLQKHFVEGWIDTDSESLDDFNAKTKELVEAVENQLPADWDQLKGLEADLSDLVNKEETLSRLEKLKDGLMQRYDCQPEEIPKLYLHWYDKGSKDKLNSLLHFISNPDNAARIWLKIRQRQAQQAKAEVKLKLPSKAARKAYELYYAAGKNQKEVAELLHKEKVTAKRLTQGSVSRLIKQFEQWLKSSGLPVEERPDKPNIRYNSKAIDLGKRTDGRKKRH